MPSAGKPSAGKPGARKPGPRQPAAWLAEVHDRRWVEFFYLNDSVEELEARLRGLRFQFVPDSRDVPFNAQVRGYRGARDDRGELWLLKPVEEEESPLFYRLCELAYYLDFWLQTLSAPTLLVRIEGVYFRATKVITEAVQISSYNYLEEPFRTMLANDLINRWLMFDEDRNPNNYMVIHNSLRQPLVVAIDFNHSDLESETMKVTGDERQFGWRRAEKTRFLTLLKPESFQGFSIEDFDRRLKLLLGIPAARLRRLCASLFAGVTDSPKQKAALVTDNLLRRREYIDGYFRKWFTKRNERAERRKDREYEGLGKQFVEYYKKKT